MAPCGELINILPNECKKLIRLKENIIKKIINAELSITFNESMYIYTLRSRTTNPLWGVKDFVMRFFSLWMTFFGLSKGYLVTMVGHCHRALFRYNT